MGQKSYHQLHRINTSMTWTQQFYNKKFRFLSYVYYTLCINIFKYLNKINYDSLVKQDKLIIYNEDKRFFYFYNIHLIEIERYILLYNIYSKVTLQYFL